MLLAQWSLHLPVPFRIMHALFSASLGASAPAAIMSTFADPPELPKKCKKVSGKKPTQKGRLLAQLAAAEADAESAAQRERDALQRFGDVRQPCSKWGWVDDTAEPTANRGWMGNASAKQVL